MVDVGFAVFLLFCLGTPGAGDDWGEKRIMETVLCNG